MGLLSIYKKSKSLLNKKNLSNTSDWFITHTNDDLSNNLKHNIVSAHKSYGTLEKVENENDIFSLSQLSNLVLIGHGDKETIYSTEANNIGLKVSLIDKKNAPKLPLKYFICWSCYSANVLENCDFKYIGFNSFIGFDHRNGQKPYWDKFFKNFSRKLLLNLYGKLSISETETYLSDQIQFIEKNRAKRNISYLSCLLMNNYKYKTKIKI